MISPSPPPEKSMYDICMKVRVLRMCSDYSMKKNNGARGWGGGGGVLFLLCGTTNWTVFIFCIASHFTADGPQRARLPIPPTATLPSCLRSRRIFPSLPGSRLTNFYRDASSALLQYTTRQPIIMVEFYLLAFSRFPLPRMSEKNPAFDKYRVSNSRIPH